MCMQNIDHTLSWDGYDLNYLTHFHFQVIQNNIIDFIDHFWCSDLISTTWTYMVSVLGRPQRNSVNHSWTIPYNGAESE